jgi:hypothetical protein
LCGCGIVCSFIAAGAMWGPSPTVDKSEPSPALWLSRCGWGHSPPSPTVRYFLSIVFVFYYLALLHCNTSCPLFLRFLFGNTLRYVFSLDFAVFYHLNKTLLPLVSLGILMVDGFCILLSRLRCLNVIACRSRSRRCSRRCSSSGDRCC